MLTTCPHSGMLSGMTSPTLLEADLQKLLKDQPWGSPDMAARIKAYLGSLLQRFGLGALLSFTSLADLGVEATAFVPTAAKLAELQSLDVRAREDLYRRAWTAANGEEPPRGAGFKNLGLDILLEGAHRLRRA